MCACPRFRSPRQRGAALLLAMVVMTLIATVAGGMVWQYARSIDVEAAERARLQSSWVLNGALDWARLILREDARNRQTPIDHLGEPWAVPLAEARLSTFLAADRSGTTTQDDEGPEAFLSGSILDAQARWNLGNLIVTPTASSGTAPTKQVDPDQLVVLQNICSVAGAPSDTSARIADGLLRAALGGSGAPIAPRTIKELTWLGLDRAVTLRLEEWMVLLPAPTPVNVNTASREVLAATVPGAGMGWAQSIVDQRQRKAFDSLQALGLSPQQLQWVQRLNALDWKTSYFVVRGRLRLDDRVLEESSLVHRRGSGTGGGSLASVDVIQRERVNLLDTVAR